MARGVNKVTLIGNLGNDPEVKYTQSGMAVASVSLATTSVRKDRDGNPIERTEWHRVKFFGKLAEIVETYLTKGSQIYVEGSIRYDKYTDNNGVEKYTTDIICDDMQMMGGGNGQQQGARQQQGSGRSAPQSSRPAPSNRPASRPAQSSRPAPARREPAPAQDFGADFADDDIPF